MTDAYQYYVYFDRKLKNTDIVATNNRCSMVDYEHAERYVEAMTLKCETCFNFRIVPIKLD